ncbi:MAG: 23S rRNA (pseudouridine(1915)-N(3))-methyltransferase RlmH [Alphaproteobacteria bacterium]
MRVKIAAIGKAKASPELQLTEYYLKRLPWKTTISEHDAKSAAASARKEKEAQLLLDACAGVDRIIALDESGSLVSSMQIAQQIGGWQQQGSSSVACIIGGADGLHESILKRADVVWSFGRVTWPHMLVRAMLAEQLYRAHTILQNHPYHREG